MQPSDEIIKLSKDILMGVGYTKEGRKRRFRDENEAEEEKDDLKFVVQWIRPKEFFEKLELKSPL